MKNEGTLHLSQRLCALRTLPNITAATANKRGAVALLLPLKLWLAIECVCVYYVCDCAYE